MLRELTIEMRERLQEARNILVDAGFTLDNANMVSRDTVRFKLEKVMDDCSITYISKNKILIKCRPLNMAEAVKIKSKEDMRETATQLAKVCMEFVDNYSEIANGHKVIENYLNSWMSTSAVITVKKNLHKNKRVIDIYMRKEFVCRVAMPVRISGTIGEFSNRILEMMLMI